MDIYTPAVKFEPFWWEAAPRPELPEQALPQKADVVIVGSGYTGLNAAIVLAEGGANVLVVEADKLGIGASSRNGGAIGATLRYSFATLIGRVGLPRAVEMYKAAIASREFVFNLVESRGFACDLVREGRFYGAHKPEDYGSLQEDLEKRKQHVGSEAVMVSREEQRKYVGTDRYYGGRFQPEDGSLHPARFHAELVRAATAAGATIVDRTRATGVERERGEFVVGTTRGTVRAEHVIVATNAYTSKELKWFRRKLLPIQSQIIATEPLPLDVVSSVIPSRTQLGDTAKLHNYYRCSPDRTRVLFGGRSGAAQVNDFSKSGQALYRRMTELFPKLQGVKISHSWGGFIGFSFDQFPHMTEHEGVHYIGGCCGSGVAMMSFLGHETSRKILGKSYEAALDRPFKSQILYNGNPWFMPAIITALELRDRFRI
jgi:glycine/D-amino acid oxidase-like deaminating enzyme